MDIITNYKLPSKLRHLSAISITQRSGRYQYGHLDCLQYVDSLRLGKLALFRKIEDETSDWWFPTLDRGLGACLHFAADHGQVGLHNNRPACTAGHHSYDLQKDSVHKKRRNCFSCLQKHTISKTALV